MNNTAEEKRIQEINEIACLFDPETVKAAKYGPNACTAQEMAYLAAQKALQSGISSKMFEAKALVRTVLNGSDQGGVNSKMEKDRAAVKDLLHGQD